MWFILPCFYFEFYIIYTNTHTHTWFLSTLVCSYSRALCYCFAFAASATPPSLRVLSSRPQSYCPARTHAYSTQHSQLFAVSVGKNNLSKHEKKILLILSYCCI